MGFCYLKFNVMVVIAYILALVGAVAVKFCIGALNLLILACISPLQSLVSRSPAADQLHAALGTFISAIASVGAAYSIFQSLDAHFSVASVLVLATPFIGSDLRRIGRCLRAWQGSLINAGLDNASLRPSQQDTETHSLYDDVGREIAYMVGNVVGFAIGGWQFIQRTA
jgi:hypothetical protein